jgi:PEGA domain
VTTGAPLYLVSACGSAEEFVAAFRRYADRGGLFVPIADPLPAGKRGRVALALTDGRIILEGEIEVSSSWPRPSPLYGRIGMTLKFVAPDDATKTTLTELEKARLAMKPPPLTAIPRAGDVPATPRAVAPPIGGRIDAANALAESIAIGDVGPWRDGTVNATPKPTVDSPSQKFVIPTIPQVGASRPKTPSVPPALQPKTSEPTKPPPLPGTIPVVIPPKIITPPIGVGRATVMGMPALDREPAASPEPPPVISAKVTLEGVQPATPPTGTTMGMPPIARAPSEGVLVVSTPPRRDPTPIPKRGEAIQIPKREIAVGKQTTLGMPIVRAPADTEVMEAQSPPPTPTPTSTGAAARRAHTPSTPPAPRNPTPFAPLPVVKRPAMDPSVVAADEPTDLTEIPPPPVGDEQKKTSLGVQMMSAAPVETNWEESGPAYVGPPPDSTTRPSGSLRASEIMAAMKGEDWVMAPDASQPTIVPKSEEPAARDQKAAEEKSGPDDWAISLDPQAPGGWSAPAKVEKLPEPKQNPASGNRNIAVASSKAIEAVEWEDKPTGIGEALVEIDPSLMARPPTEEEEPVNIVSMPPADVPPPLPTPPPFGSGALPLLQKPPPPPLVVNASASFPSFKAHDETEHVSFLTDSIAMEPKKKPRTILIAAIAAFVVLATVATIFITGVAKHKQQPVGTGSGSAVALAAPADAAAAIVVDAPREAITPPVAIDAGVAAPATCNVDVTTSPSGAELSIDKTVVGTAPTTLQLPCGVATKILAKKDKWGSATKAFTASATATKLTIKIPPPLFQLKVTSIPSGATITIAGKVVGITPTTIKVPAFAGSTITLTKDSYAPDTQKVTAKQNNATHMVTLKHVLKKLH